MTPVDKVRLIRVDQPLTYEAVHAPSIAAHWAEAQAANPTLFNGLIHVASAARVANAALIATCHGMRFAALTHWRHDGTPSEGFRNIFGTMILRASDGALLLARAGRHNALGARLIFPGGAFDDQDIAGPVLDADGGIRRECLEEVGLGHDDYQLSQGYVIYQDSVRVCVARIARLTLPGEEARAMIMERIATMNAPELDHMIVVPDREALNKAAAEPYCHALADWTFAND